jgi:hypothetical protein
MEEGTHCAYPVIPPSQRPLVLNDERTGSLLLDTFLYPYYPPVNAEARNHILCGRTVD